MYTLHLNQMTLVVDFPKGQIHSLMIGGQERITCPAPLFRIRLRDRSGGAVLLTAYEAKISEKTSDGARYTNFENAEGADLTVQVYLTESEGRAVWRIFVTPADDRWFVEWVDFPLVTLPALKDNHPEGKGGRILLPYNEGALISDLHAREQTDFRHYDPEYPSLGCYSLFPNMISSQMLAYLWKDVGLYLGAHDPSRGVKGIDFFGDGTGVTMQMRLFCGVDFGEPFDMNYPIVWAAVDHRWESAAEIYRRWFESSLPPQVKKVKDNPTLPSWYEDSPLVVSYPVRGKHDMDEMSPNALYPYTSALPLLEKLRRATESRLLVLLMHWEGTAPWAPPYVWPPFGGEKNFHAFKDALHAENDLLGVYCSGFGFTVQSNLIDTYNCCEMYDSRGLSDGMCTGPDGQVSISKICTGQRSGYDICPASPIGHALLAEAYSPLFKSGLDYVQILDQNHGGGQYFCYSRQHGHPPAPGPWMTEHMQHMLTEWNGQAPGMLFGCESAAAEPFIGNLAFSDNRFELNYMIGVPVPLYAYVYHEYVRNFMGNQVCSNLYEEDGTLPYRLAYSFSIGDCMTLVMAPEGDLMDHWGTRDFEHHPNKDVVCALIANLTRFYREQAKPYLYAGRMIPLPDFECEMKTFRCRYAAKDPVMPAVHASAWEAADGSKALILVNPSEENEDCVVQGEKTTVPALKAVLMKL